MEIDYIFDGGGYQGELAIFSLEGMDEFEPGSEDFIQEASSRALSSSEQGHVVISDADEGARFSGKLGERDQNAGEYLGVKSFNMRSGDTFGVMLVPNKTVAKVFDNPGISGSGRPLFSMVTSNPYEGFHVGQIADVTGDGSTFVMEDIRMDGKTDSDYNDIIFQIRGAKGKAALMDEVLAEGEDWRETELGQGIIEYVKPYVTPDAVDEVAGDLVEDVETLLEFLEETTEAEESDTADVVEPEVVEQESEGNSGEDVVTVDKDEASEPENRVEPKVVEQETSATEENSGEDVVTVDKDEASEAENRVEPTVVEQETEGNSGEQVVTVDEDEASEAENRVEPTVVEQETSATEENSDEEEPPVTVEENNPVVEEEETVVAENTETENGKSSDDLEETAVEAQEIVEEVEGENTDTEPVELEPTVKQELVARLETLTSNLEEIDTEESSITQLKETVTTLSDSLTENSEELSQVQEVATTRLVNRLEAVAQQWVSGGEEPTVFEFGATEQPLVGVIDTGFSGDNPDIDYERITLGTDYVEGDDNPLLSEGEGNEHGTHILGIIGATQDNGIGIDGVNDTAPLWVSRAIGSGQWAESLVEFVDAAKESGQPNAVVNLSLDLTQVDAEGNVTTRYELTPQEREAIEYARQNGVLIVAAAGNDGDVMSVLGQASQEFDNILTVGAAEQVNPRLSAAEGFNRAEYSSYGQGLDLLAPGGTEDNPVFSTVGEGVGTMAGTSVATAKVTGAVSQVWAANPELSYRQVVEILKETATDLETPNADETTGAGLLNLLAAVQVAKETKPEVYNPVAWLAPETWSGEGEVTPQERAARGGNSVETAAVQSSASFSDVDGLNETQPTKYYEFTVDEGGYFKWNGQARSGSVPSVSLINAEGESAWRKFYTSKGAFAYIASDKIPTSGGGFLDPGTYHLVVGGGADGARDYSISTEFTPDVVPNINGDIAFTNPDTESDPFTGSKSSELDVSGEVGIEFTRYIRINRDVYGLEVKEPGKLQLQLESGDRLADLYVNKMIGSGEEYSRIGAALSYLAEDKSLYELELNPGLYEIRVSPDLFKVEDLGFKAEDVGQIEYRLTDDFTPDAPDSKGNTDPTLATVTLPIAKPVVTSPPNAVNHTALASESGQTASVPPLTATDPDNDVLFFKVSTVPEASEGTLFYNGVPVQPGQTFTIAQASQLVFSSNPGFVGDTRFIYTATDSKGNTDPTPGTVTLPIVAPPPTPLPVAPQPGEGKVPSSAGDFEKTTVSNGVTKHYYENGYLTTQPSGASFWYSYGTGASTSVTIGAEPVEPSPKSNVTIGAEPVDSDPKSNVTIGAEPVESNPKSTAKPIVNVWDQTIGEEEFFTKTIDPQFRNESLVSMRNRFSWSHPDGDAIEAIAFYDFSPNNSSTGHFAVPAGFTPPRLNVLPPQYGGVSGGVASIDQLNQNQVYYSHNGNIGINDTVALSVFDGSQWSTPKPFNIHVASDKKRAEILSRTSDSGTGRLKEATNFRRHPWIDTSTLIQGYVPAGTTFRFLEKVTTNNSNPKYKTWYKVRLDDGRVGYIWEGGFRRTIENPHDQRLPVIEFDPPLDNDDEKSNNNVSEEIPLDEISIPLTKFERAKRAAIQRVGESQVGRSTGQPRYVTVGNSSGWVQEFEPSLYSFRRSRRLLMLEDGSDTAYWIEGENLKEYEAVGGLSFNNPLGFPRNDETPSNSRSNVFWQAFSGTNGTPRIHRKSRGLSSKSVASWGPISDKYEELWAVNGSLGAPTKRQWPDPDGFTLWAEFEKGRIAYNTRTYRVTGHLPHGASAPWQRNLHALDVEGSFKDVHLKFVSDHPKAEDTIGDRPTWIITHGWNSQSIDKPNFTNLAQAIGGYEHGDQVLKLDWRRFANTGVDGLAKAASWIKPIGKTVANTLQSWGLESNQINLVGHSLGAYVSFEIAKNLDGVNSIIALDPAATTHDGYSDENRVDYQAQSEQSLALVTSVFGHTDNSRQSDDFYNKRYEFIQGHVPTGVDAAIGLYFGGLVGGAGAAGYNQVKRHSAAVPEFTDWVWAKDKRISSFFDYS
ncbi:S8 family serine peptidase [Roseofilum sp. BLCC_M91]|uniref:S8 family serine peptidase n=1 Tax=Roseofilum halophilum BLCC-M91 TaxID=3022259 RepID=A0ABT7BLG5_9CYAN|nr:S8 family serine peptidase [Roseofilum halophilum]MDJ1180031.1 S8 family serine peptidase [Roseofilum halophilum BLCC-M91]